MLVIYGIKEVDTKGEKKDYWQRIGAAFKCKDGSLNCKFDYFPSDPAIRINIREPRQQERDYDNGNRD